MRFVAKVVQNALLRFRLHERSDARVMREPMPMLLGGRGTSSTVPPGPASPSGTASYRQRTCVGLRHAVLKGIRPDEQARQIIQSVQLQRGPF